MCFKCEQYNFFSTATQYEVHCQKTCLPGFQDVILFRLLKMKKGNKQCLLDTPRRVTVNNKKTCIKMQKIRENQLTGPSRHCIYAHTKAMAL